MAEAESGRPALHGRLALGGGCVVHWMRLGPMDNLVYLVEDARSRVAAVVDPAWDPGSLLRLADRLGLAITDALLTHTHDDHINALELDSRKCCPRVHLSLAEAECWVACPATASVHTDGERIRLGTLELELLLTPGHSPGSACYALGNALFTGDTLFVFGCGRCDLPGGDARAMYRSLQRLTRRFPDTTLLLPGHHYAEPVISTLREQRWGNPFLHCRDQQDFVAFRTEHNRYRQPPYEPVPRGISAW